MADALTSDFALIKPEVGASLDTWGGKLNENFDRIARISRGRYTAGGTANAITITTGLSLTAIPNGMEIRFFPGANNTGATTINVDGIGAVNARTARNTALPADYISTVFPEVRAFYNGTNWIVWRPVERITSGSGQGTCVLYENGHMEAHAGLNITSGGTITWTFQRAFSSAPAVVSTALTAAPRYTTISSLTASSVDINGWGASGIPSNESLRAHAMGSWY